LWFGLPKVYVAHLPHTELYVLELQTRAVGKAVGKRVGKAVFLTFFVLAQVPHCGQTSLA